MGVWWQSKPPTQDPPAKAPNRLKQAQAGSTRPDEQQDYRPGPGPWRQRSAIDPKALRPILHLKAVELREFINRIEQCLVPLFLRSFPPPEFAPQLLLPAPSRRVRPARGHRCTGVGKQGLGGYKLCHRAGPCA